MASEPTNGDLMQAIGQLQGNFSGITERLDRADESRAKLYDKIDTQTMQISEVSFAVKTAAMIAAQARDRVEQVAIENADRIENNKKEWQAGIADIEAKLDPILKKWNEVNTIGKFVAALLALGGVSIIGGTLWFGSLVAEAVRHWLGISGGS